MKLRPLLLALTAAVGLASLARATDYEARTFTDADGGTLGYRLLPPKVVEPGKKYPLVLFLHGSGERGTDNAIQVKYAVAFFLKPEVREKFPCYVLAPQCPPEKTWSEIKSWSGPNAFSAEPTAPTKRVLGTLDALLKELPVDPDRLYVTGLSMGGYGTWDLLARTPERWAAAAPICGGGDAAKIVAAKDVPIWAFHGALDPIVPVARTREMIVALRGAGGQPMYSEYPYVKHDSWSPAYGEPELLPWLFAQRRGQPAVPFATVAGPLAQPPSSLCPGDGPMQSGLWFRAAWKKQREQWAKDKDTDQGAVVFFGDSITHGWKTLAQDFPRLKTANRGISGDTTRGLRARLQGDVLDLRPRAVAILIGTNDLDQGAAPELVALNLRTLVADLHKAQPDLPVIISKVMPRGALPGFFPEKIKALNTLIDEDFKDHAKVTLCDTWTLFDAGNGQCRREEFPDMLHPNAAGYAKWTAALRPILEKLGLAETAK